MSSTYPDELTKDKKCAVRKRTSSLEEEEGECNHICRLLIPSLLMWLDWLVCTLLL